MLSRLQSCVRSFSSQSVVNKLRMTESTPKPVCKDISLDKFAHRQFDSPSYAGTKIPIGKDEFMKHVAIYYNERKAISDEFKDRPVLIDGYAPFCKHIFMPNFDDRIVDAAIRITDENESLLRTKYEARKEGELPVLSRFFPEGSQNSAVAKYLDLICTSFFFCPVYVGLITT